MLGIECCLSEQSFHCCDVVNHVLFWRSTSCVQHAPPRFSEHLHPSLVRRAVADCTGCWVLNPGPWAFCTPQPHPSRLPSFVSWGWGWGLSDQLFGHCWWESRFCFTNSRAHKVYRKPKVPTHSVSLNSELSGHCWHLKSSCSQTTVWNFFRGFIPGRKQKTKIHRLGCGLVGVLCSASARLCVQTLVKKIKG